MDYHEEGDTLVNIPLFFYGKYFPKVAQKGSTGQDLVPLHALATKKKKVHIQNF